MTAVIITVAVLDIIDVLRVLPVLAEPLFTEEVLYQCQLFQKSRAFYN